MQIGAIEFGMGFETEYADLVDEAHTAIDEHLVLQLLELFLGGAGRTQTSSSLMMAVKLSKEIFWIRQRSMLLQQTP